MSAVADIPERQIINNDDGTKTIISYTIENGTKYKITQKVAEIKVTEKVSATIAERKKWHKYGIEKDSKPGPDQSTTQIGEEYIFRLGPNWRQLNEEAEKKLDLERKSTVQSIKCRYCGGPHFSTKCPNKPKDGSVPTRKTAASVAAAAASNITSSTYVPPSLRRREADANAQGIDILEAKKREQEARTLRLTNLNESANKDDLVKGLLAPFSNSIEKAVVVENRTTGRSRGFAYVTFSTEKQAEVALDYVDGRGFMNLIIHADWSQPKDKK
ncbi:related to Eukaryotic translation initiation factor 3 subunit G [Saccharomycodes ludwigii]|uniref:Eukaryotic translation initiation factor 3 subunit G n=1 Tax=Saccharomycodes ludwigii TaxID=36035 RepID=A0A376B3L3_9ASCO|nr:hypothetical protein SCDLUD_003314 [Saccharomycodes ludwigii]KAH3900340.1 hypothetical protein SCDLUD_003314 [Saccharomycodes ludwigii]SSD59241.1 related to Eukaryotic translation initiation factor 3 subunit G [Saccharomycodes ludwigii]